MCLLLFISTAASGVADGAGLFATSCKPPPEGHSLRDTYERCEPLQLPPAAPRRGGAAALTFTRASIRHQREPWEAGAASPACHRRTLLAAGAVFCKGQKYTIISGFHTAAPPGRSFAHNVLHSSSLRCVSAVLLIHRPLALLPEAPADPAFAPSH